MKGTHNNGTGNQGKAETMTNDNAIDPVGIDPREALDEVLVGARAAAFSAAEIGRLDDHNAREIRRLNTDTEIRRRAIAHWADIARDAIADLEAEARCHGARVGADYGAVRHALAMIEDAASRDQGVNGQRLWRTA